MQLPLDQFGQMEDLLPRQRGNVLLANSQVLNAILFVAFITVTLIAKALR